MLTSPICGIRTTHADGAIFRRPSGMPYWLLMRFHTPFFYVYDGVTYTGETGQLLLNAPETPLIHGTPEGAREGFCNDWIYFDGDGGAELIEELGLPQGRAFSLPNADILSSVLSEIEGEIKRREAAHAHKISALITSLLVDLGRECNADGAQSGTREHGYDRSIKNAHTAISENCGYPWTLSEMAKLSGYSVSRFCSLYKNKYGITPTEHLINRRISKAKKLLVSGEHNVTETSALCGFSSLHYFSVTFKRHVGVSPSEYAASNGKVKKEAEL